jgi:3-oxoacyl-[acyl-carrier-protein] synthase II
MLAIEHQFLPPTIHHETPDETCDLDVVPGKARNAKIDRVLSNSFAFGGNNTSLLFGRFDENGGVH